MTTAGRFQLFYKKAQLDLYEFQAHEPVEWLLKVAEAMLGNEVQGGEAIMKALSRKGEARVNPEHAVHLCQTGRLKSYAVTLEERFDVESDKTEFFYRLRTDLGNVLYADFLDRVVTPDQLNMAMKHCVGSAEKKGDIIEMWLGLLTLLHQCEGYLDVVKGLDAGALLSGLERALLIYATSSRTTATANTKRRGTYANFINEITEQELARAKTIGMDTGAEGASSSRVTPETEGHDEFIFGMDRDGAEARLPVMSESQKSALRRFNDYLDGACLYCGAGDRSLHNCVTESERSMRNIAAIQAAIIDGCDPDLDAETPDDPNPSDRDEKMGEAESKGDTFEEEVDYGGDEKAKEDVPMGPRKPAEIFATRAYDDHAYYNSMEEMGNLGDHVDGKLSVNGWYVAGNSPRDKNELMLQAIHQETRTSSTE